MSFTNRIRIPIEIKKPQFPVEKEQFRLANGVSKTIRAIIKKTFLGATDYLPESIHQKIIIPLTHDDVTIEGDKYLGGITLEGDYEIGWNDFLNGDYPIAPAAFTIQVTPFDATNANCQSCEEANQLSLVDDIIDVDINEGDTVVINVATNDNICCYPSEFSLITFDSTYIASATIDENGQLTIIAQASMPSSSLREFLTYRVTCPNGAYDEATVSGVFIGSEPAVCGEITALDIIVTGTDAEVSFTEPTPNGQSYSWELYDMVDLGVPEQAGSTVVTPFTINFLNPSTEYRLIITTQCYGGGSSSPVSEDFTVPDDTGQTCGRYQVQWSSPTGLPSDFTIFNYTNCAGNSQNDIIFHGTTKTICALQTTPGNAVHIVGVTVITYLTLC